jgi:CheY-like chemotaxis protein
LTAWSLASERAKAQASGMNDFITKPFSPEDMLARVQSMALPGSGPAMETTNHAADFDPDAAATAAPMPLYAHTAPGSAHEPAFLARLTLQLNQEHHGWLNAPDPFLAHPVEVMRRQLHKLTGAAGMLGLTPLHHATRTALDALAEPPTDTSRETLAQVATELQRATEQARKVQAQAEADACALNPPNPENTVALTPGDWLRLSHLLEQNSLDALDMFRRLRPALLQHLGPATLAALEEALASLHFAAAFEQLRQHPPPGAAA